MMNKTELKTKELEELEELEELNVTGGRGYDRNDDPKHDGESESECGSNLTITYGVPMAQWFLNTDVGRWIGSIFN